VIVKVRKPPPAPFLWGATWMLLLCVSAYCGNADDASCLPSATAIRSTADIPGNAAVSRVVCRGDKDHSVVLTETALPGFDRRAEAIAERSREKAF
jgi:hypothetical protein